MGLAASQVRLLMLTGRKDDVESSLMGLANDKLSLGRKSASASKEYSNALNATKLVWQDGSTNGVNLTYNALMQPNSVTSDSGQFMLADNYGRAVLNDTYADILGGSGATDGGKPAIGEEDFLVKMGIAKDATEAKKYLTGYTPEVGSTGTATNSALTYDDATIIKNAGWSSDYTTNACKDLGQEYYHAWSEVNFSTVTTNLTDMISEISNSIGGALSKVIGSDISEYLATAERATLLNFVGSDGKLTIDDIRKSGSIPGKEKNDEYDAAVGLNQIVYDVKVGSILEKEKNYNGRVMVDSSQVINTFMNYFDIAYAKGYKSTSTDQSQGDALFKDLHTSGNEVNSKYSKYFSGQSTTRIPKTVETPAATTATTTASTALTNQTKADFYINMWDYVNQNGWTRSSSIDKSDGAYLQNQVSNGNVHLCKFAGDPDKTNNIVESSWDIVSTSGMESLISSESDDAKAATAKSKYEETKDELDYKESMIDLQITNLDTERSALDTEVDSVKAILNKNIERGFKIFQNG